MRVWITKYALTEGIFVADGEVPEGKPDMVCIRQEGRLATFFHGNDWHKDWPSAEARAKQMVAKAIESAEKKIGRLKALTFADPA